MWWEVNREGEGANAEGSKWRRVEGSIFLKVFLDLNFFFF